MEYVAPERGKKSFTCPHCGVLAQQSHSLSISSPWQEFDPAIIEFAEDGRNDDFVIVVSRCDYCKKICIWHFDKMVHPNRGSAPMPNPDMPEEIKKDYEEAASIYTQSPRGASALLRLDIQKLCIELGGKGKNINDDIKMLVTNGLPVKIQQSLDIVRVIGNSAVHPGQIVTDDPEVAGKLFILLNIITEYMISIPNKINQMYSILPEKDKNNIENRDNK